MTTGTAGPAPPRWFVPCAWLGIVARVVLAVASTGSNDIRTWERFGGEVRRIGLSGLYGADPLFNHPPLAGLYGAAASAAADGTGLPFPLLFKLPLIAADALALVLLQRWTAERRGARTGALAALAWGWAPCAILVTGFHGNTDSLCAALLLGAVVLVAGARMPLAGGLVFAAAVNVKLIPVLAGPALLALAGDRRATARFLAGASVGAIPFALAGLDAGAPMFRNLFGWSGMPELWGIFGALRPVARRVADHAPAAPAAVEALAAAMRPLILALAVGAAVHARRTGRRLDVRLPALAVASLLLLAPGFGIQWLQHAVPLLLAADLAGGAAFAAVAGAYLTVVYLGFVVSWAPLTTLHTGNPGGAGVALGALTWITLAAVCVRMWRQPSGSPGGPRP